MTKEKEINEYQGVISATTPIGSLRTWVLNDSIGIEIGILCFASKASASSA